MAPLFTIGIASYNYQNYILRGLEAIKNQTYQNYEILISDDASTDNVVELIEQFIAENPDLSIRFIRKEKNGGLVSNKNTLIQECKGEYLMICDADDWMAPNCLEKIAQEIALHNPDRVIVEIEHVEENGNVIQTSDIVAQQTMWGWNIHHGCANRVSILREHNIQIAAEPDDVYFTIEFSKYCKKVIAIHETLYYWLVHLDSAGRNTASGKNWTQEEARWLDVCQYIQNVITDIESGKLEKTKRDIQELQIVQLKLYYFYLLFVLQKQSLCDKLSAYHSFRAEMKKIDQAYLENAFLKKGADAVLRPYALRTIRFCAALERAHLMSLALVGYHVLTKIKYFDQ